MITRKDACSSWSDIMCQHTKLQPYDDKDKTETVVVQSSNGITIANRWLFRGQKSSKWDLESSYSRLLKCRDKHRNLSESDRKNLEKLMLDSYKAYAYAYIPANELPESMQLEEWLVIMQHHGTATRLVDWTYNFFTAVFFAVEDLKFDTEEKQICSVWCIRVAPFVKYTLEKVLKKYVSQRYIGAMREKKSGRFNEFLNADDEMFASKDCRSAILQMTPARLNHRLAVQQGTFLLQADLSKTMCEDIYKIQRMANSNELNNAFCTIDIQLEKAEHIKIMRKLQEMNITHQTLFPDLEGYSRSVNTSVLWLDPKIDVRYS